ncbi:hypothetical protein ACGTRS_21315 [Burkholderia semiarida]|uniref:Uncharacterized protein n=1 Tax=Burkholderia semiarida TaxID=2843303 RepID=A0ABW7L7K2_9BURK
MQLIQIFYRADKYFAQADSNDVFSEIDNRQAGRSCAFATKNTRKPRGATRIDASCFLSKTAIFDNRKGGIARMAAPWLAGFEICSYNSARTDSGSRGHSRREHGNPSRPDRLGDPDDERRAIRRTVACRAGPPVPESMRACDATDASPQSGLRRFLRTGQATRGNAANRLFTTGARCLHRSPH